MSEADRVFSRHEPSSARASSEQKHFIHTTSHKRGLGNQTRTVEVVHVRRGVSASIENHPRPAPLSAQAVTSPDGFNANRTPQRQPDAMPVAPKPAPQVGHVLLRGMPAKQAELPEIEADRPRSPRAVAEKARRFADPFAAGDSGANCIRCGYLVEVAREKRGKTTCATCA